MKPRPLTQEQIDELTEEQAAIIAYCQRVGWTRRLHRRVQVMQRWIDAALHNMSNSIQYEVRQ